MPRRSSRPSPFREPTTREEMEMALERTVEKAVLMHPDTVKLRKQIEKDMRVAAKPRKRAKI